MAHIIANFHGIHKAKKPRISNLQGIKEASDINSDVDTDDIEIQGPPLYQA